MKPDPLTLAATPVTAMMEGHALWQGSGFFYVHNTDGARLLFLVTARHLLAGEETAGSKQQTARPDEVLFQLHESGEEIGAVRPIRAPLYTRHGVPAWIESATEMNVAVVPIPGSLCEGIPLFCVDQSTIDPTIAPLEPGAALHLVGFGYGLHRREHPAPVWQTGFLASDPGAESADCVRYWINVNCHPGMSGAIAVVDRPSAVGEGYYARRFAGLYSGMPSPGSGSLPEHLGRHLPPTAVANECGAWGHLWRAEAIVDLVASIDTERWHNEILVNLP